MTVTLTQAYLCLLPVASVPQLRRLSTCRACALSVPIMLIVLGSSSVVWAVPVPPGTVLGLAVEMRPALVSRDTPCEDTWCKGRSIGAQIPFPAHPGPRHALHLQQIACFPCASVSSVSK